MAQTDIEGRPATRLSRHLSPAESHSRKSDQRNGAFWLYVLPWVLGFLIFSIYPIVFSAYLAFSDWDIIGEKTWVGVRNFETMTNDPLFWQSLRVTGLYTLFAVPFGIIAALGLAMLLNQKIWGVNVFRTIYYLPAVISGVAASLLWAWIFNPEYGILNNALALIGIEGPKWLFDETWVIPSIVIMSLWSVGGSMVLYLAALQGVPTERYEAAKVDGAGWWARFRHITLPSISPVIFFTFITGLINSFQTFTQAYIMTSGGPNNASLFYGLYLYNTAFRYMKMGYASALAWVLLLIILILTLILFLTARLWVHYEADTKGGW